MMISVIIPTYNRVLGLGRLLDAILSQTLPTEIQYGYPDSQYHHTVL
jgi:glycosyltransferase involved in cell wall biosynthesis